MLITDGQNKYTKLSDRSRGIESFWTRKSLPSGLLFFGGAKMGRVWTTNPVSVTKQNAYMEAHCVNCMDYTHKGAIGQGMVDMDYTPGIWNFDTCHTTCWQDRRTKNNDRMRQYYWDKKAGVVKNRRAR
jgi:hypothetical protein